MWFHVAPRIKVVFCTPHDPFDSRSLSLAPLDMSKDQGSRPSTYHLTYDSPNALHLMYEFLEYLSTSYHHWISMHPPFVSVLEVTTYWAHISCVFTYNSMAIGFKFSIIVDCSTLLCIWSIDRFRCHFLGSTRPWQSFSLNTLTSSLF